MKKLNMLMIALTGLISSAAFAQTAPTAHAVQITAINFLTGGLESCSDVNHSAPQRIFMFESNDSSNRVSICRNSRVELVAMSNAGHIVFSAIDLSTGAALPAASYSSSNELVLGQPSTVRFSAANPYGFSYVMAEEVTGIDPSLLAQWNQLQDSLSRLRAEVITARQSGASVSDDHLRLLQDGEVLQQRLLDQINSSSPTADSSHE